MILGTQIRTKVILKKKPIAISDKYGGHKLLYRGRDNDRREPQ
jgi:hypothetical protein